MYYITEQCEFDNYTLDVVERIKLSTVIDFCVYNGILSMHMVHEKWNKIVQLQSTQALKSNPLSL